MRSFNVSASLLLACLVLVCAAPNSRATSPDPAPSPEPKTVMLWRGEKWMLDYTNWVRKRNGAGPVIIDPKLQESCRRHCAQMARTNSMVHSNAAGENIAMGQSGVPQAINTWEHSSGHFVNMVNPSHRVCGMACYQMPNGQRFFCQQFSSQPKRPSK